MSFSVKKNAASGLSDGMSQLLIAQYPHSIGAAMRGGQVTTHAGRNYTSLSTTPLTSPQKTGVSSGTSPSTTPVKTPDKNQGKRSIQQTPESHRKRVRYMETADFTALSDSKRTSKFLSPLREKIEQVTNPRERARRQKTAADAFRKIVFGNPGSPTLLEVEKNYELLKSNESVKKFTGAVFEGSTEFFAFDGGHITKVSEKTEVRKSSSLSKGGFSFRVLSGGHMLGSEYYKPVFTHPSGFSIGKAVLPAAESRTGRALHGIKSQFPFGKNDLYLDRILNATSKIVGQGKKATFCEIETENKSTGVIALGIKQGLIKTAYPLFIVGRTDKGDLNIGKADGHTVKLKSDVLKFIDEEASSKFAIDQGSEALEVIDIAEFFNSSEFESKGRKFQADIPEEFNIIDQSVFVLRPSHQRRKELKQQEQKKLEIEKSKKDGAEIAEQRSQVSEEESDEFEGLGGLFD